MKKIISMFLALLLLFGSVFEISIISNADVSMNYTLGNTQSGTIYSTTKNDIYRFSIPTSGRINLSYNSSISTQDIFVQDTNSTTMWSHTYFDWNDNTKQANENVNIDLLGGTYYFVVKKRYDETGNYNFKITFTTANESFNESGTLSGNNNGMSTADSVNLGTSYTGQIAVNDDTDVYQFNIPSSGRINVTYNSSISTQDIFVQDTSSTDMWSHTYLDWNENTKQANENVNIDLLGGTYYFVVKKRYDETGNYNFKITFTTANESFNESGTLSGNNNEMYTADSVNLGTSYTGQIAVNDDTDVYKFIIPSSGRINVTYNSSISTQDIFVQDTSSTDMWSHTYLDWNENTKQANENVNIDLLGGTYYFVVKKRYDETGNYNFKITFTTANESFNESGTLSGDNNEMYTADSVSLGATYTGQIAVNDEIDTYQFTVSGSKKIILVYSSFISEQDIYILDSQSSTIWNHNYLEWNESTKQANENAEITLSGGTYYFVVKMRYGNTGNYQFSIDEKTNVCTHSWNSGSVTKSATCTASGIKTYTCRNCGATKTETIPATGHYYVSYEQYCLNGCGTRNPNYTQPHTHYYYQYVVKPTATEIGYTEYYCSCGSSYISDYKAPTGKLKLKHKARSVSSIAVTWNNVKTATGYQVQISTKDGKKWSTLANLKAGTTSYTFKKLSAGNNYKFRVRFYIKAAGTNYYSPWSSTLNSPTLPAGTSLSKLTAAKKSFTAQWKKASVTGYQVQYALKSSFSSAKTLTVKNAKTLKATVKKLNARKVYYVRIRTYKTISKVNYFSDWSKNYKVKTK